MPVQQASTRNRYQAIVRFILLFIVLTILLFLFKSLRKGNDNDFMVLLFGNFILFLATALSFFLYNKSLQNNNPNVFIRFVYGGMMVKMVICLVAAVTYIFVARSNLSKWGLIGCLILYIIYTFAEVKTLTQISKQQKNG